jgi:ABC-2 type transport system permease protein
VVADAVERAAEYVAGKALAAVLPLLLLALAPVLTLYAGNVLFAVRPVGYVQQHLHDLRRIVAAGVLIAGYFGLVGLAISSLTGRRTFAVGGDLAFLIVPTIVGAILADSLARGHYLRLLAFAAVPIQTSRGLYPHYRDHGHVSAEAWALTCLAIALAAALVLAWRYRGGQE